MTAVAELIGHQRPRIASVPYCCSTGAGEEAAELSAKAGLMLDDWQSWSLKQAMGTREDGRWAAFEVGMLVSRQNGKNGVLEARQLAGLFLIGESLLIHTAHEFKAANEHFRRMRDLVESQSWLRSKVRQIRTSHGDESIELRPTPTLIFGARGVQVKKSVAPRLRFLARSRGSGRAFTCDCLFYDEAMILSDEQVGASLPTLSAVPNPQVWYTASAGMQDSTQLNRVRNRGIQGSDDSLVWLEWSIDKHHDMCRADCTEHDNPGTVEAWARANPGLGIRISVEHVARERVKMSHDQFERERLGVGDWPTDEMGWAVIPEAVWDACESTYDVGRPNRIAICADVTPDQSSASIVIAGLLPDGRILVERGRAVGPDGEEKEDHRAGTTWVVPRLKELASKLGQITPGQPAGRIAAIVIDPLSPTAALLTEAEKAGLDITTPTTRDVGQAFGQFYTLCAELQLAHFAQDDLRSAVAGAVRRDIGDGQYAWARKATTVDISPLCAATLAAWAANKFGRGYDVLKSIA